MHAVERFALKKLQANHCKPFVCHAAAATWALNISVRSRSILSLCETLESDSYGPAKEAKDLLSNLSLFLVYVEGQPEALDDHVMRMAKRHVKLFFFRKKSIYGLKRDDMDDHFPARNQSKSCELLSRASPAEKLQRQLSATSFTGSPSPSHCETPEAS